MHGPGISIGRFGRSGRRDLGDILQRDNLHDTLPYFRASGFSSARGLPCQAPCQQILHANIWHSPKARRLPVWPKGSPDEIRGGTDSKSRPTSSSPCCAVTKVPAGDGLGLAHRPAQITKHQRPWRPPPSVIGTSDVVNLASNFGCRARFNGAGKDRPGHAVSPGPLVLNPAVG
jgi:hypothetical protein